MDEHVNCVVCRRSRARAEAEILVLTDIEKAQLKKAGRDAPEEIAYCRPCFRLMNDQRSAVDLMTGTFAARLRAVGVANADQLAEQFKKRLLAKSKRSS